MADPTEILQTYVQACNARDEDIARACSSDEGWTPDRDGPGKLFKQAAAKGFRLVAMGAPKVGRGTRAALEVMLATPDARSLGNLVLLGEGEPWRLQGLTKSTRVAEQFLVGHLPARPAFGALAPSPKALTGAQALGTLAAQAATGDPRASDYVQQLVTDGAAPMGLVAWLVQEASEGRHLHALDGREVPGIGRCAVQAELVTREGATEPVWLYARWDDEQLAWTGHTEQFHLDTLLAPVVA